MQLKRAMAGTAAILALFVWPAPVLAILDGSLSHAAAIARFTDDSGAPTITSFPEQLEVTLSNTASESYTPAFGPWLDDFGFTANVLGMGTVRYGSATGALQAHASATPEFVAPGMGNPNLPVYLSEQSSVLTVLRLDFEENVVVSGGAPGTPVTLSVNLMVQSLGTMVGGHPTFAKGAGAQFYGRVIDLGGASIEHTVYGSEVAAFDLATAVGEVLSVEGFLLLRVEGTAGTTTAVAGYYPEYQGSVESGIGGLWFDAPQGVEIAAPSGHDYTIAVPEPGRPLLLLLGAAMLLARLASRAESRAQRA